MPEIIDWPTNLRIADRSDPQLIALTRSPGEALNGDEQIIASASQRWVWQIQIPIITKDALRAFRRILTDLDGRYGYLRLRVCDTARITRKDMGAIPDEDGIPHSDGAFFSDGSGYALAGGSSSPVAAVAARGTSIQIDTAAPLIALRTGVFFSINGWLYEVMRVDDPVDPDAPGTIRTVHIKPPLRTAITTDDEIRWDADAVWRLATDGEGQNFLRVGKFGLPVLNLVEPVSRDEI